jgi:predicted amidohydrolase
MFLAACVQLRTREDIAENWKKVEELVLRASRQGAKLIMTPENTLFLGPHFHNIALAQSLDGAWRMRFSDLAKQANAYLLIGSIAEKIEGETETNRCYNTSLFFSPEGDLLASYRKIHLFDVSIPNGLSIRESDSIQAGDQVVVVQTPLGAIGLSICYDLRFPELYRKLVEKGAEIIAVPSAFTLTTGKDHWHALLRARAIDNQCFVLAPGQWGVHDSKGTRRSYGHSLIVDPWGAVLADRGQGEGIAFAEIDLERLRQVRQSIPLSDHRIF